MPTQVERTTKTRAALMAAARDLFAEKGFAGTGREEIAERAGVTRGALYHHFASKAEVFGEVVEQLEAELVERVIAAALAGPSTDAFDLLQRSCRAYLDACTEPAIARILITDAPAVLGQAACRDLNARSCVRLLAEATEQGIVLPGDAEIAAALLVGTLNEAAALVASGGDRARIGATVDAFLARLVS